MDENISSKQVKNWLSPVLIIFILYVIFFLPFWQPLLLAFVFACACAPVVNYLRHRLHRSEKWTAYLVMGALLVFVFGLLTLGGIRIYSLLYSQFQNADQWSSGFDKLGSAKDQLIQWMKHIPFLNDQNIETQVNNSLTKIGTQARVFSIEAAKAFVVKTPEILLNLFIFLAAFAVLLAWGPKKWEFISRFPGLGSGKDLSNYHHFEKVCAISIGSIFLTGFLQATLVGIGAGITGYPIFISFLLAFILSLIPVLGAASVPVVLAVISFANGSTSSGIILLVTAAIAGSADNVIRAYLFSKASNTNPVVSLLALLGGISLFGFPGLFLAPIVEQLVMAYLFTGKRPNKVKEGATRQPWRQPSLRSRPDPT